MTLRARRRGPIPLLVSVVAAGALIVALDATAQQPPAGGAAAQAPAAAGATAATPAKKPAAKAEAAVPDEKSAESYSLGLQWGETLKNSGLTLESISSVKIAQGIRDALSGKATPGDQDRENVRKLATSAGDSNHKAAAKFLAENAKKPGIVTTKSGLQYQEIKAGSGDSPKAADSVTVNYRGTLLNGTEFDSSYTRGHPETFEVGRVIPGWTEALQLMKTGSKYQIFIPSKLAYGEAGFGGGIIPPNATLIFEVELLSVKEAAEKEIPAAKGPAKVRGAKKPDDKASKTTEGAAPAK